MKKLFLSIITLIALAPAIARAEDVRRFEHEGNIYRYTITQAGERRVITGVEEKTGKPFKLRVGTHQVRGTVGSQEVQFSLKDVKPLAASVTVLAAR